MASISHPRGRPQPLAYRAPCRTLSSRSLRCISRSPLPPPMKTSVSLFAILISSTPPLENLELYPHSTKDASIDDGSLGSLRSSHIWRFSPFSPSLKLAMANLDRTSPNSGKQLKETRDNEPENH
ncbi:hypothetical protein NL676_007393 [Syzygium grande]|nr:hypothetical protein NL676_007393 [Syzygium grande]